MTKIYNFYCYSKNLYLTIIMIMIIYCESNRQFKNDAKCKTMKEYIYLFEKNKHFK